MTTEKAIEFGKIFLKSIENEKGSATYEFVETAVKMMEQEPKTGHWVRQTDDYHDYYECEYCGIAVGLDDIKNYCPNCGCRMLEGSE